MAALTVTDRDEGYVGMLSPGVNISASACVTLNARIDVTG